MKINLLVKLDVVKIPFYAIVSFRRVRSSAIELFSSPPKPAVWEFASIFETKVRVELLEGYKRAVCDT